MIRRDYHEYTLADAMLDVDLAIGRVRLKGGREDAEFITGRGVIRTALLNMLKRRGLSPSLQLGNDGVIVCVIE